MTIGQRLREARERLGLTLEEAERTTRIRAQHLAALERDDFDALPSPVQARGFLRNYASYLGLDPAPLLQANNGGTTGRRPAAKRTPAAQAPVRVRRAGWLSGDLVVAAVIALGTLALLVWGGGRAMASLRSAAAPAGESSAFLIATSTPSSEVVATVASPLPLEETPGSTATLPLINLPSGRVSVRLLVVQRAWVRAQADGVERVRGRVEPGAILDLTGDRIIEVTTGNGAALRIALNGQDMGLMGRLDEAVTRIWTPDGEVTPTPTITPTETQTVRPSATPRATASGG